MKNYIEELIQGISEVVINTEITASECIAEASEMLDKEKEKYVQRLEDSLLRGW